MSVPNVTTLTRSGNGCRTFPSPKRIQYEDRIAAAVGRRLGIRPSTAAHLMDEIQLHMVVILEELNRAGAEARKQRLMGKIRAADTGKEALPLVPATWQLAREAACREHMAETAFLTDNSDQNLSRLIGACEESRRWADARLLALYADKDRRRRMPS